MTATEEATGSSRTASLLGVDSIEIHVIVNDEVDYISPSRNANVIQPGRLMDAPLSSLPEGEHRGGATKELRMSNLCCGALGLSLLIKLKRGDTMRTVLFDTGPSEPIWASNAARLGVDLAAIEHIHLSHWHRDHSGGMLQAVRMIASARKAALQPNVIVEVHPERPDCRGMLLEDAIISMEPDPTFDEIEGAGGVVVQKRESHTALDGLLLVSGEIPRQTGYELGVSRGGRFVQARDKWISDELIVDERLVAVNLKGRGLVVFTGCSHAGVINASRHALTLAPGVPLYAIVGGYHLADALPEKLQATMEDLQALKPQLLMPGHCTGWRFKFAIEKELPGSLVPLFAGSKYTLV